jgi:hypothetical protein
MKRTIAILAVTMVSASVDTSCEAQVIVQQPVFSQFSIGTTVIVPDRGWAHLGSIQRAESSRSSYGCCHPGSSIGFSRMHTGMSVGVTIINLAEMDRMILGYDPSMMPHGYYPVLSPPGEQQLKQQKEQLTENRKPGVASAWFKLGRNAEAQGRLDRARDCYKIARASGSTDAAVRLAALARPKRLPVVATNAPVDTTITPTNDGPTLLVPRAP